MKLQAIEISNCCDWNAVFYLSITVLRAAFKDLQEEEFLVYIVFMLMCPYLQTLL